MESTDDCARRQFLKCAAAALMAASCWGGRGGAARAEDQQGLHGMLIVGEQNVFLSHLPMFGSVHDYQVILEATFAKAGSDPQSDYLNDRKRPGTKLYTIEPEQFVLPRLVAASSPLHSFKANVYRQHFERFDNQRAKEAATVAQHVDVNVTRVIHFRRFDPKAAKLAQLEYILFGKGTELFLAHLITRPPDFDQVLPVKAVDQKFSDEELAKGVAIVFAGRPNSASKRILKGQTVTGQIKGPTGATPKTVQLQPGTELYFEKGELEEDQRA